MGVVLREGVWSKRKWVWSTGKGCGLKGSGRGLQGRGCGLKGSGCGLKGSGRGLQGREVPHQGEGPAGAKAMCKEGGIQLWLQEKELGSLEGDEAKQADGL